MTFKLFRSNLRSLLVSHDAVFPPGINTKGSLGKSIRLYGISQSLFLIWTVKFYRISDRNSIRRNKEFSWKHCSGMNKGSNRHDSTGMNFGSVQNCYPGRYITARFYHAA